jgi:hypothetical protein
MDRDNSLLPLYRQDTKKGKESKQSRHQQTTHRPRSPHHRWWPPHLHHHHHRYRQEHKRGLRQRRPTQQELVRHRGRRSVSRQARLETQEAGHPANYE